MFDAKAGKLGSDTMNGALTGGSTGKQLGKYAGDFIKNKNAGSQAGSILGDFLGSGKPLARKPIENWDVNEMAKYSNINLNLTGRGID